MLPLTAVLSFAASLFYSLAENAQLAVTPHRLEDRLPDKRPQEIESLLAHRAGYHLHCLILSLLWSSLFVLSIAGLARALPLAASVGLTLACTLIFPIFIGRVFTQAWAGRHAEGVFLRTLGLIRISSLLFGWLTWPLATLLTWLGRAFGLGGVLDRPFTLPEDLFGAVVDIEDRGTIPEDQREMIEGIIELRDAEVIEIMTPRTDMLSIDVNSELQSAISQIISRGHYSRIPVFEGDTDHIIGVLYLKDILRHWGARNGAVSIRQLVRPPIFIPETKRIEALLKQFQQEKVHIAIVLDEYGGTSGLVTIEDILEEIVGEIEDEYDPEEGSPLHLIDPQTATVSAKLHIDELNEGLQINLPEEGDFETVGGFIFAAMGRVPKVGETLEYHNIAFEILEADERKLKRIKVSVSDPAQA